MRLLVAHDCCLPLRKQDKKFFPQRNSTLFFTITTFRAPTPFPPAVASVYQNIFVCATDNCNTVAASNGCTGGSSSGGAATSTSMVVASIALALFAAAAAAVH